MSINWTEFSTIAVIHLFAVASPGPDFAVVVRNSIHYGRAAALMTSLGVGAGIIVHVTYSIIGLSLAIATTTWLFDGIKYLATTYLLVLAYKALTSKAPATAETQDIAQQTVCHSVSLQKAFINGFITNGINPKATLFFLSLFTLIIAPDTALSMKVFYGGYLAFATAFWFCFLSLVLNVSMVASSIKRYGFWIDRAMGVLLVIVAVNIFFFAPNQ